MDDSILEAVEVFRARVSLVYSISIRIPNQSDVLDVDNEPISLANEAYTPK